ncbi:hypothetical protein FBU30_000817 [Linnemannia zychae]|nr:hypothetical protein FBU30_000817 [Linnemannia zychae]
MPSGFASWVDEDRRNSHNTSQNESSPVDKIATVFDDVAVVGTNLNPTQPTGTILAGIDTALYFHSPPTDKELSVVDSIDDPAADPVSESTPTHEPQQQQRVGSGYHAYIRRYI